MRYTFTKHALENCERWSGLTPTEVLNMLESHKNVTLRGAERSYDGSEITLLCDPELERFPGVVLKADKNDPDHFFIITVLGQNKIEDNLNGPISIKLRCEVARMVMPPDQYEEWLKRDRYRGKIEGMRKHKEKLQIHAYIGEEDLGEIGVLTLELRLQSIKQVARSTAFWTYLRERMNHAGVAERIDDVTRLTLLGNKGTTIELWQKDDAHEHA